jgi:hypothetical protein
MDTLINPIDRAALQLAIDLTLAEDDEGRVEQVKQILAERAWDEVARFCSYHRQYDALSLLPWQLPPCEVNDPDQDLATPQHMLTRRMLALGISQYHPEPIAAIEAAEKKAKRSRR